MPHLNLFDVTHTDMLVLPPGRKQDVRSSILTIHFTCTEIQHVKTVFLNFKMKHLRLHSHLVSFQFSLWCFHWINCSRSKDVKEQENRVWWLKTDSCSRTWKSHSSRHDLQIYPVLSLGPWLSKKSSITCSHNNKWYLCFDASAAQGDFFSEESALLLSDVFWNELNMFFVLFLHF